MKLIQATTGTAPAGAIKVSSTVYLVDEVSAEGFQEATQTQAETAVPVRTDLPAKHPLAGRRLLKIVPCGFLDVEIVAGRPRQVRPDGTYLDDDIKPGTGTVGEIEDLGP